MRFNEMAEVDSFIVKPPIEGDKTIILIGAGRSCTSMVAAVIDGLGCPMDGSKDGHFERESFKNGDYAEIEKLNKLGTWGVQLLVENVKEAILKMRNPHLVLVFRDLISNAQRLIKSEDIENPIDYIKRVQSEMLKLSETGLPCLLLSCEIRYKKNLSGLINFVGKGNEKKALKRIGNGYIL